MQVFFKDVGRIKFAGTRLILPNTKFNSMPINISSRMVSIGMITIWTVCPVIANYFVLLSLHDCVAGSYVCNNKIYLYIYVFVKFCVGR